MKCLEGYKGIINLFGGISQLISEINQLVLVHHSITFNLFF